MSTWHPFVDLVLFASGAAALFAAALLAWVALPPSQGRPSDLPEALFLAFASVTILAGWFSTTLASLGLFSLGRAALLLWVAAAAWLFRLRRHGLCAGLRTMLSRPGRCEIGLGLLLLLCSVLYVRPHETVLGGSDAGTYLNMAVRAAADGGFVEHSGWTEFLVKHGEAALRQQPPLWRTRQIQFVGWYIDDGDPQRTLPQFFLFHPSLLAIGVALGGPWGGLLVTPLWGVAGIAAVYFLARRLFGAATALLAAGLLAVTSTSIYFARYPTTEPLTLLLVFAALLALQTLWDEDEPAPLWGLLAGAALGAALLTRIDLPVVLTLVFLFAALRRWQGRWSRAWTCMLMTIILFAIQLVLTVWSINWPYVWNTYATVLRLLLGPASWRLIVPGLALLGLGIWLLRSRMRTPERLVAWVESDGVRWGLALLVIGLSAYAYFLRPRLEPVTYTTTWPGDAAIPRLDGQNWVRLGWYLTPLGLLLATVGLVVLLRRASLDRLGLFLSIGVLTTVQYVYHILNTPYHIYAMRRYVPIVIPTLWIYAAVALMAVAQLSPPRLMRAAAVVLGAALFVGLIEVGRPLLPLRDGAGAAAQLAALDAQLRPEAIILIADPPQSTFADTFGVPLHTAFDHDVATVRSVEAGVEEYLNELVERAADTGRPLQVLAVDAIPDAVRRTLDLEPVAMIPFSVDNLMNTYEGFPSVIQTTYYGLEVYDVSGIRRQNDDRSEEAQDILIDVGTLDGAYLDDGFFAKESLPDAPSMRWTSGEAGLELPIAASEPVTVSVTAMIYRPQTVAPAPVDVRLDDEWIGEFVPTGEWQTFIFPAVANPENGVSQLSFHTQTFNPQALGQSTDDRNLGFLIDRIAVDVKGASDR